MQTLYEKPLLPGLFRMFNRKAMLLSTSASTEPFFVVLGAGMHQIPLIREARKAGYRVIAVDRNLSAPGFVHADLQIQCNIEEHERIVQTILENAPFDEIVAVSGRSYGILNRSAALVAESFKTPFLRPECIDIFLNKRTFKKELSRQGVPVPRSYSWKKESELEKLRKAPLPLIYRPSVGHSKLGIGLIKTEEERTEFLNKIGDDDDSILIEEFVEGREITVIGMVFEGEYHPIVITEKVRSGSPPLFAEISHRYPASIDEEQMGQIEIYMRQIVHAAKMTSGPLLAEFLIAEPRNGKPKLYLVETAPEIGGEFLADHLIPEAIGINYFKNYIDLHTGRFDPANISNVSPKRAVVIRYLMPENGLFMGVDFPPSLMENPSYLFSSVLKAPMSQLSRTGGNNDRPAVFAMSSPLEQGDRLVMEAERIAREIRVLYEGSFSSLDGRNN